jgi:hypothetical protein
VDRNYLFQVWIFKKFRSWFICLENKNPLNLNLKLQPY